MNQLEFRFKDALVPEAFRHAAAQRTANYLSRLQNITEAGGYKTAEAAINLPADPTIRSEVRSTLKNFDTSRLRYILVIGIGGSNLGAKAIYDALLGSFDLLEPNRFPKLIFIDTPDPEFLKRVASFLNEQIHDPDELLINIISESGSTTETIANAEFILSQITGAKQTVVTTSIDSKLWQRAGELDLPRLAIPKAISGRYSVLSPVGLLPLAAAGLDIDALCLGAATMRARCLTTDSENNPALASAITLVYHAEQGTRIHDTFLFHPELESLGKWYRQLLAESIGKEHNRKGETVHAGITPTVSIGSTDLHSVGQLTLGGPKNKVTCFVSSKRINDIVLPKHQYFPDLVPHIGGRPIHEILNAILSGTQAAYRNHKLPFFDVLLPELSEHTLGQYLMWRMIEVMLIGELFNINVFDQPNVESYKLETKRILAE